MKALIKLLSLVTLSSFCLMAIASNTLQTPASAFKSTSGIHYTIVKNGHNVLALVGKGGGGAKHN